MKAERPGIGRRAGEVGYCDRRSLTHTAAPACAASPDIALSNSLTDLAARIKVEHESTAAALKRGAEHAIAAGKLLLEAKLLLKHGQWLPWLKDNCAISERTARLYMRLAQNQMELGENGNVADLSVRGALAMIARPKDDDIARLSEAVVEVFEDEFDHIGWHAAEAERAKRAILFETILAKLDRIIEYFTKHPERDTAWHQERGNMLLSETLLSHSEHLKSCLEADLETPFAISPQATKHAEAADQIATQIVASFHQRQAANEAAP